MVIADISVLNRFLLPVNATIENFMLRLKQLADRHAKSLLFLLLLNGFIGALAGVMTAEWQASVESAQVMLGLVPYEPGSLQRLYFSSTFSLINYISAGLLALTHSEMMSSILIAAFVASIMQQTVAMVMFLVFRNVYAVTLASTILIALHFMGHGIAYTILPLGTIHTFGRIGQFFILYAILFLPFSYYRTGFFLSGLSLWVHPAWGVWLLGCLTLVYIAQFRIVKPLFSFKHLKYFAAGIMLSAAAYVLQNALNGGRMLLFDPKDSPVSKYIFYNYIRYWDYHRRKIDDPLVLTGQLFLAWVSAWLASVFLYKKRKKSGECLFFSFIALSTVIGSCLVFIPSWFNPNYFPAAFIILMPARFINTSIFVCSPLLVGFSLKWVTERAGLQIPWKLFSFCLPLIFIVALFTMYYPNNALSVACIVIVSMAILYEAQQREAKGWRILFKRAAKWANPLLACFCMGLIIFVPFYTFVKYQQEIAPRFAVPILPPHKHYILTTIENAILQVQTRTAILTPHLDGYIYAGDAAMIPLNAMSEDIFNISLMHSPPAGMHLHGGTYDKKDFKKPWEERSCSQWKVLSSKYNFDLIIVPSTIHLQLPEAGYDPEWNEYWPYCPAHKL